MMVMATRRAALDEGVKEKIRQRVRELLKEKDGGQDSVEPDVSEEVDDSAGELILFDEPESKTARIARRFVAIDFDTQDELERYLKDHPDANRSMHTVKPKENKGPAKEEAPAKERKPGEKDETGEKGKPKTEEKGKQPKKGPAEKPEMKGEPEKRKGLPEAIDKEMAKLPKSLVTERHPSKMTEIHDRMVAVKDSLIDMFGAKAKEWSVHKVDPSQIRDAVMVQFPDGTSKKYGELTNKEQERVHDAVSSGLAATKGMNNYTSVSSAAMHGNMANNLAGHDDKSVEETKLATGKPASNENATETADAVRTNGRNLVRKYGKALSKVSRPMAEKYVDDVADAIHEGLSDGSLAGVSQDDLDEFIREDLKRIIHQEVETRGRSLGDHGMRHVAGNVRSSLDMMGELQQHGVPITGKQKLMAIAVMANHDLGYTVGEVATDIRQGKRHVEQSKALADEESERYDKIFGAADGKKIRDVIATHDSADIDWDKDPMASAVRLADNTALFGKDKVQDLFIRSPKAVKLAAKLRMAAEMVPSDYDEKTADPEIQKRVAKSKELQKSIKEQLHDTVEEMDVETLSDAVALHAQIDEMSEGKFSTSRDVLSRLSGKLKGFSFDPDRKMMKVDMAYSPEGEMMQELFGDDVAAAQFDKFAKDMKAKPLKGNRGKVTFSNPDGKKVFEMDVDGFDKDPIDTATTGAMREFLQGTARGELRQAALDLAKKPATDSPEAYAKVTAKAKKTLEKGKHKFTEKEWKELMDRLDELAETDVDKMTSELNRWPLLDGEMAFLEAKTAAVLRRIVAEVAMGVLADRVAAQGIQLNRKNRDTMRDTGGKSKHSPREPEFKPSRTENKNPFRTRNLTKEEKDPDTDRDSDMKLSFGAESMAKRELARSPNRFVEAVRRAG